LVFLYYITALPVRLPIILIISSIRSQKVRTVLCKYEVTYRVPRYPSVITNCHDIISSHNVSGKKLISITGKNEKQAKYLHQCCGSGMIYFGSDPGSGSDFSESSGSDPGSGSGSYSGSGSCMNLYESAYLYMHMYTHTHTYTRIHTTVYM
jgi:uncharacterized membrane protein YgcG